VDELESFTAFAVARRPALVQLGWAMTGDRHLGEDLAQATLDRLWRRWLKIVREGDPWPYAQRTLASISATWWRRRWRTEYPTDRLPDVSIADATDQHDTRQMVERWLRILPPRQRAVVVLRFLADMSVEDTARAMRCTNRHREEPDLESARRVAEKRRPGSQESSVITDDELVTMVRESLPALYPATDQGVVSISPARRRPWFGSLAYGLAAALAVVAIGFGVAALVRPAAHVGPATHRPTPTRPPSVRRHRRRAGRSSRESGRRPRPNACRTTRRPTSSSG